MSAFDRIIGYVPEKEELMKICDFLRNRESYEKLGTVLPRGLLIYGLPRVGKTLMATALIEESGRKSFSVRKDFKDSADTDVCDEIVSVFESAKKSTPSVVFLDGIDKLSNSELKRGSTRETSLIESLIDGCAGLDVFVIATAVDEEILPFSLLSAGRIDRKLEIPEPCEKDSEAITEHYLSGRNLDNGTDIHAVSKILGGSDCSQLEKIINEAGIYAGYERKNSISADHIVRAFLKTVHGISDGVFRDFSEKYRDGKYCDIMRIIYHEAGHAVVSEVLCPESVTVVTAYSGDGRRGGFAAYNKRDTHDYEHWKMSRIISALGGRAMIELKFGLTDCGVESDMDRVFSLTREYVVRDCSRGFLMHGINYEDSPELVSKQERIVADEVERFYLRAKEILANNTDFVEKIAFGLAQKGFLTMPEIQKIKSECGYVGIAA